MVVIAAIAARAVSAAKVAACRLALRHLPLGERARLKVWMALRGELARWK